MQQDEKHGEQHEKSKRRRGKNTAERSKRAGKQKAREEQQQQGARKKAKRTNATKPPPLGAHTPTGGGERGGSGGQGQVQGGHHSDVSRSPPWLPVSTRTLRGCLIGEGQLNKELIPPKQHKTTRSPKTTRSCGQLSEARGQRSPAPVILQTVDDRRHQTADGRRAAPSSPNSNPLSSVHHGAKRRSTHTPPPYPARARHRNRIKKSPSGPAGGWGGGGGGGEEEKRV
jgi:hypothetical protein